MSINMKSFTALCGKIAAGSETLRGQVQTALIEASVEAFATERNVQPFDLIAEAVSKNQVIRKAGLRLWIGEYAPAKFGEGTSKLDKTKLEGLKAKFESADDYRAYLMESPLWDSLAPEETLDFDVSWRNVLIKSIKAAQKRMEKAQRGGGKVTQSDVGLLDKVQAEIAAYNLANAA